MIFAHDPRPESLKSLAGVRLVPFWLDDPLRPEPASALIGDTTADLLIIGAGFTGLWAALLAREENPGLNVVLIEAGQVATGATGRNGGFVASSLTHGFPNGFERWPRELAKLTRMGHANLEAIGKTIQRYNIDCDYQRTGELTVALEPHQLGEMQEEAEQAAPYGEAMEFWDQEKTRARVNSPTYLGGLFDPNVSMVNPARLAWGLRRACLEQGVRLYEQTPALEITDAGSVVLVRTPYGSIRASKVALATNAYPPLLKHLSFYIVPVYDYVLMTEPLTAGQRASIGWAAREGVGDAGNQFHYYRTTEDGRILWGGYDAVYHWNNGFGPHLETDPDSFGRLADHFFTTFPQLSGVRFTHAWGGAIDTCSRFSAFWGTAHAGKTAYVVGYTGLGVGASRFGAQVMLDLLSGQKTERTELEMVRSKPFPFPPEPFRSVAINFTRWSLDQADRNQGKRNIWLRTLDAMGLGFDS